MKTIPTNEQLRKWALETLVSLGIAQYINPNGLYHGRAGDGTQWEVDPNFNNAANNTGNHNVFKVPGLYAASDITTAEEFARKRAIEQTAKTSKKHTPEVHKVVSSDEDSIVLDLRFDITKLSNAEQKKLTQALSILLNFSFTEKHPIKFEYKEALPIVSTKFKEHKNKENSDIFASDTIETIIGELKHDKKIQSIFHLKSEDLKDFVLNFLSAYNTKKFLNIYNLTSILISYLDGKTTLNLEGDSTNKEYPFSSSYITAWCTNNNIAGFIRNVNSVTAGKTITTYHLIDTQKIMTEKQHGEMLQSMLNNYEKITEKLSNPVDSKTAEFLTVATAEEVMQFINQSPECKTLLEQDAHIWEGWTVGQHTQAVLEFFDKNYSEDVPEQLRPFIKIVLLAHDIGKGFKDKHDSESKSNLYYAKYLYDALELSPEYRQLINYIITDSQQYTSSIVTKKSGKTAGLIGLENACKNAFIKSFNRIPSKEEINGLKDICIILQTCDSGAYTRFASISENGTYVTGGNDRFTASFTQNSRGLPRLKDFIDESDGM